MNRATILSSTYYLGFVCNESSLTETDDGAVLRLKIACDIVFDNPVINTNFETYLIIAFYDFDFRACLRRVEIERSAVKGVEVRNEEWRITVDQSWKP